MLDKMSDLYFYKTNYTDVMQADTHSHFIQVELCESEIY